MSEYFYGPDTRYSYDGISGKLCAWCGGVIGIECDGYECHEIEQEWPEPIYPEPPELPPEPIYPEPPELPPQPNATGRSEAAE